MHSLVVVKTLTVKMSSTHQEIVPYLWLGGLDFDEKFIQAHNIKYIISLCQSSAVLPGVGYIDLLCEDTRDANISQYFQSSANFIHKARQKEEAVLVHCGMGWSRSPTIVAAYLISHEHMSYKDAMALLVKKRPRVEPNDGFLTQLQAWEKRFTKEQFTPTCVIA
jgi:hypothetical protein